MRLYYSLLFILSGILTTQAQIASVVKTNPKPVYVHYMPWFETTASSIDGRWGWHWTMDKMNPEIYDAKGKREIASHYYPLIGPYASNDIDVIEYHLLLMKLSGIDGVFIDWYGVNSGNGDFAMLFKNSDSIAKATASAGLSFGLTIEDRYWESVEQGHANMKYAEQHYFNRPNYIRYGAEHKPVVTIFGPITFETSEEWKKIYPKAGTQLNLLTLEYQRDDIGPNASGEFAWPYQSPNTKDHAVQVENFYKNRAPQLTTAMGIVYPGFHDFYAQGQNEGASYFNIPHHNGQTLDQMLQLTTKYSQDLDMVLLATWNDFGEGTMFEPTQETGFSYLVQLQKYTGVSYTEEDLKQVYRYYLLRKKYRDDLSIYPKLDQVYAHFVALRIPEAVQLMCEIEGEECK